MTDPNTMSLGDATAMLSRTPAILADWLEGAPETWTHAREGAGTWNALEIVGHLIHGERTDWIPRARQILAGDLSPFAPFDREAMLRAPKPASTAELLREFAVARRASLEALSEMNLGVEELGLPGTHPELGRVTLGQLLAAWGCTT